MIGRCARTREVIDQTPDELTPELSEHVASCSTCSDARVVQEFLHSVDRRTPSLERLPEATVVWWRSRHLARQTRVEQATQPIRWLERVGFLAGTIGALFGAALVWPQLKSSATQLLRSVVTTSQSPTEASPVTQTLFFATAILALVAAALYAQWAED